jgi:hypothetical protein
MLSREGRRRLRILYQKLGISATAKKGTIKIQIENIYSRSIGFFVFFSFQYKYSAPGRTIVGSNG